MRNLSVLLIRYPEIAPKIKKSIRTIIKCNWVNFILRRDFNGAIKNISPIKNPMHPPPTIKKILRKLAGA